MKNFTRKETLVHMASRFLAIVQVMALLFLPVGGAFATAGTYSITLDPVTPVGATVNISGTVTVGNGAGNGADQYDVQVLWDSTGNTADATNTSPHNFTPATGNKSFTGTWSNSHTYTASGAYTIKVRLYHQNISGNDGQADSIATVQVSIVVPPVITTGSLTVNKVVVGTSTASSSFALFVDGNPVTTGVATTTSEGSHVVSETPVSGYTAAFSGDCDSSGNVTVSTSTPKTCTLTNTWIPATTTASTTGSIVIHKVTAPTAGTNQNFTFNLKQGTTTVASTVANAAGTTGSLTNITPGSYTLVEQGVSHWNYNSSVCYVVGTTDTSTTTNNALTLTVQAGKTIDCTFTNTYVAPAIGTSYNINFNTKVVTGASVNIGGDASSTNPYVAPNKHNVRVDWGDGSTTESSTITPADANTNFLDNGVGNFFGNWANAHTYATSGTYSINVDLYYSTSSQKIILISTGQSVHITVPVTTGSLIVNKVVVGGDAQVSDFPLFVDGNAVTSGATTTVSAGSHTVTESSQSNYHGVFGGDCNSDGVVTVATSSVAVCTLTNTFQVVPTSATVHVHKVTIPAGIDKDFTFNLVQGTTTVASTTANAAGSEGTISNIVPGSYDLIEEDAPLWAFSGISCQYDGESVGSPIVHGEHLVLDAGDVVDCTFTNMPNQGGIQIIKKIVAADGTTTLAQDLTSFIIHITGFDQDTISQGSDVVHSPVTPGSFYTVTEDEHAGYELLSISPDSNEEVAGGQFSVVTGTTTVITIVNKSTATTTATTTNNGGGNGNGNGGNNNGGGATGGGNILGGGNGNAFGRVLGAETGIDASCSRLLTDYLRLGKKNNTAQVKILQSFLNKELNLSLPITGFFGNQTDSAVRSFQIKYGNEVLAPWVAAGLHKSASESTGYVFKTTQRWINLLNCPALDIPMPQLK